MKATIEGIKVEGTPQEISEFIKLHSTQRKTSYLPNLDGIRGGKALPGVVPCIATYTGNPAGITILC